MTAAVLDMLLDALLERRDEETVRAMFAAHLTRRRGRTERPEQLAFDFPQRHSDDAKFAEAMANFDERLQEAMKRKRQREAEEEERRSREAAKRRAERPKGEAKAALIRRGATTGKILALFERKHEWRVGEILAALGCGDDQGQSRVRVALHDLVSRDFLTRVEPGVYRGA